MNKEEVINSMLSKLVKMRDLQDSYLEDKEEAYRQFKLRPCADDDLSMIIRQDSIRNGYVMAIMDLTNILKNCGKSSQGEYF